MLQSNNNQALRVGIAGLGRSGWDIHAAALVGLSDRYQIAAVSDPARERCEEAAQRFACRVYPDTDNLIRDPELDLVVVATPSLLHAEHAAAAMRAGRHVVCEKPMAMTVAEADDLIAVATQTGRVLAPFQNLRYGADFLKVREVINSGVLGRIVQIRMCRHSFGRRWDWQTLRELGGGELNNTGPHAIDQALELFGPAEPHVFYHCDRTLTLGDAEDHFTLMLQAPGQPLIQIEISRACAFPQDLWLVMGTSGALRGSSTELTWKHVDFEQMPRRQVDRERTADRSYNSETLQWTQQQWSASDDTACKSPNVRFYEDLYQTLRHGQPLLITPQSVRRQLTVIERCHAIEQQSPSQRQPPQRQTRQGVKSARPAATLVPNIIKKAGLTHA
jgi:scyllo-inositol 2-dehydrogenase (NADP+)